MIRRISFWVNEEQYRKLIQRAKQENMCDEKGWVSIDEVMEKLVAVYAYGSYAVPSPQRRSCKDSEDYANQPGAIEKGPAVEEPEPKKRSHKKKAVADPE